MANHQSNLKTHRPTPRRWRLIRLGFGCATVVWAGALMYATDAPDLRLPVAEGAAHGFPMMRDLQGRKLAAGEFSQTPIGDRLQVKLTYDFGDGHRTEENTVLRQRPTLAQEAWSWQETRGGRVVRRFSVDFATGNAVAEKNEGPASKRWSKTFKIEPGRTFAGFAFTLAIASLREPLGRGEKIVLHAIGFMPQPRLVAVEISGRGLDRVPMGGREIEGDEFLVHPKIPAIAKPFITAPDNRIWLIHSAPGGFLRSEGPLIEPKDDMVRVDLLPGDGSGPAVPKR
jgi:hypothetical protein